ncbi:UNVERIFIED_CONTAM: hypothetical protein HDU68_000948 [Siphonaria sp. JEL0065]|nr:hypothetical protein HDU68_000948 [Siphonaria sp. JEL0065]
MVRHNDHNNLQRTHHTVVKRRQITEWHYPTGDNDGSGDLPVFSDGFYLSSNLHSAAVCLHSADASNAATTTTATASYALHAAAPIHEWNDNKQNSQQPASPFFGSASPDRSQINSIYNANNHFLRPHNTMPHIQPSPTSRYGPLRPHNSVRTYIRPPKDEDIGGSELSFGPSKSIAESTTTSMKRGLEGFKRGWRRVRSMFELRRVPGDPVVTTIREVSATGPLPIIPFDVAPASIADDFMFSHGFTDQETELHESSNQRMSNRAESASAVMNRGFDPSRFQVSVSENGRQGRLRRIGSAMGMNRSESSRLF